MTSGTTSFSISRDDIIKGALRKIGVVAQGEVPTQANGMLTLVKWCASIVGALASVYLYMKGK